MKINLNPEDRVSRIRNVSKISDDLLRDLLQVEKPNATYDHYNIDCHGTYIIDYIENNSNNTLHIQLDSIIEFLYKKISVLQSTNFTTNK